MSGRLTSLFSAWRSRLALGLALGGLVAAGGALAAAGLGGGSGKVVKVRLGGDSTATRVVVELDAAARGEVARSDHDAIVLAIPGIGTPADLNGRGQGIVRRWSMDSSGGAARLTLETHRPAQVKRRFLLPPGDSVKVYRYVVDLEAGPVPAATQAARNAPPAQPVIRASAPHKKKVIVIDAGHGGRDPGASGAKVKEKAVTLAAAKALKARLEKSGRYKVVLTREGDNYVAKEQRVAIARRADADLFISLHADAGPDANLRGASVYTLSEQGADRAAKRVLTGGNWLAADKPPARDPVVNRILLDLTQRGARNRSGAFAQVLLPRIGQQTHLLNRSHREAGFVVLLAPDVPAVLLEMGFITNTEDERSLTDHRKRARVMDAVGDAIDDYFYGQTRFAGFASD